MKHTSWFVLPPLMEFYYQATNPTYVTLSKFKSGCLSDEHTNQLVFRPAHSMTNMKVFWYLDADFIGAIQTYHEMAVIPKKGNHIITAVDELGNEMKRFIEITE